MITDENDIIITLKGALKADGRPEITVSYAKMDSDLDLPAGSTKSHINVAAEASGYAIVLEGSTMVELERGSPHQFRLERG